MNLSRDQLQNISALYVVNDPDYPFILSHIPWQNIDFNKNHDILKREWCDKNEQPEEK